MINFSICLPVRNGFPYIKECVESILQQSYPNFKLHILDNNSTDSTLCWLNSLNDPRIQIFCSTESLSIVESWRRIKDIDKQEFMTLIGHDDVLDSLFLETIQNLIFKHPDAALYSTSGRLINSEGQTIRSCKAIEDIEDAAKYLEKRFKFEKDIFGTGYIMRSQDYDRIGGIPDFEKLFFADDALWLSLMDGRYKINNPKELFSIRIHSASESASLPSVWPSIILGIGQFNKFLKSYNKNKEKEQKITELYGTDFMLTYHRNAYILALIEASQLNKKVSIKSISLIQNSLNFCAPDVSHELTNSIKIRILSLLNISYFRIIIPWLWNNYSKFKKIKHS